MSYSLYRPQGGTLIFHTFKILNFNILKGFQKIKYILGYEDFGDIFFGGGGHHKIGL